MQVQVHVVHKKDFKGYTCTCMYVSCASTVCVIRLAGCVCNFTIKLMQFTSVFIIVCTALIDLIELPLSLHYWNYLRAFGS